jgi:NAD(P)-dependent dehydrogenase (short-subunit alcohol dehydrogenase family)
MIRLDKQVAIITGSGRGLGAAYARLLAERGARVVIHSRALARARQRRLSIKPCRY